MVSFHVIDEVLMPPAMAARASPSQSIVNVVSSNPDFSILMGPVTKPELSDILDLLSSDGPFTVFAPTNRAFEALGSKVLQDLDANPEELAKILTYHVACGEFFSTDLPDSILVETNN